MDRSTRQQQSNKNANFPKQVPAMSSNDCGDNALENQMENVLQLMTKRARGDQSVSNDQVEKAVSDILTSSMGASAQPPPPRQLPDESPEIQVDTGNYDDDDVDDEDYEEEADRKKKPTRQVTKAKQKEALKKQKKEKKKIEEAYKDAISQIPLGKEGAKMMTTFGDGTKPIPRAMQAALLGTRKSLQVAIMDARAIRRRAKKTFEDARQSFVQRNKSSQSDAVDPNILYRALSGHDRLTYQPKCGFDMEQLTWLFPEEMRAYQRWTNLRTEAQTDGADDLSNDGEVHASVASEEKDKKDLDSEENKEPVGGHLRERAAHFDVRTDQMKSEWYLEFSTKVRQGTFLARGKSRRSKADREWEEDRKAKRGRRETGVWETMSAQSVRFLHW